jgi:hypothetical protein
MNGAAAPLRLVTRPGHPTFLDLPWDRPLETWDHERIVQVTRGISRHVVRFVNYDGALYALKELPRRYAEREYRLLRKLAEEAMPVVAAVGVVTGRGQDRDAILITRHLDYSIPYRALFANESGEELHSTLLTALAELLVRLHLTGFFWGDCSLSNTLFRRDAGGLSAYLVDAETGEMHPSLTGGQREHDIALAEEHVVGELLDVAGELERPMDTDPVDIAAELRRRYEAIWDELTREEIIHADEHFRIDERLHRLNELGFDVEEISLEAVPEGFRLRLDPHLVEPGHHRRRLLVLTGLNAQENQARRMLGSLAAFRARIEREEGCALPESVAAFRWRAEIFEPVVAAMPPEALADHQAAEVFYEILEHRWRLSEREGSDVGLPAAVRSYVERGQAASADHG